MKKRLLCYDEENPVGIDENGVLNPSALGGGPLYRVFHEEDALFVESPNEDARVYFVDKQLHDAIKNAFRGDGLLPYIQWRNDEKKFHGTDWISLDETDFVTILLDGTDDGLYIFETYEEAFAHYDR